VDREEAVRFIPADRVVRSFRGDVVEDYSQANGSTSRCSSRSPACSTGSVQIGFLQHWMLNPDKFEFLNRFYREVVQRFEQYQVPVIELGRQTPREAVCAVFEKVNTGVSR